VKVTYRPIGSDWQGQRKAWGERRRSPFSATWEKTLTLLQKELAALGADDVVFQLDMEERDIRIDGFPKANARPRSPAVIISFKSRFGYLRYQCDAFDISTDGWKENVRAIALGLEALRQVERYGITKRGEQYTGWKALPDSTMSRYEAQVTILQMAELVEPGQEIPLGADMVMAYRRAARKAHPDVGGSRADWDQLQRAKVVLGL
jgi:hypothetical protein